jgi:hypothetical protein
MSGYGPEPWNNYPHKDDPRAPWNDCRRADDPDAPWNSEGTSVNSYAERHDLNDTERRYIGAQPRDEDDQ